MSGPVSTEALSLKRGPVSFQARSSNSKLAPQGEQVIPGSRFRRPVPQPPYMASTYVSIEATCPDTCRFKNAGCFVQSGITGARSKALDRAAKALGLSGDDVARIEADLINAQFPTGVPQDGGRSTRRPSGRPLRLHVGGDVASPAAARILGQAASLWRQRGGGPVFTYTHRWADIPVEAWGPDLHCLASVESIAEADEAITLGYMPSYTMFVFPSGRAFRPAQSRSGVKVTPCPAQREPEDNPRTCSQCTLCFEHRPGLAVGFAVHTQRGKSRGRRLPMLWEHTERREAQALEGLREIRAALPGLEAAIQEALAAAAELPT